MNNQEDINFIERYLDGDLNSEELKAFRERMENDLEFMTLCNERINIAEQWALSNEYVKTKGQIRDLIESSKRKSQITRRYFLSLAAVVLILVGIFGILRLINHTKTSYFFDKRDNVVINKTDTLQNDTSGNQYIKPEIEQTPYKAEYDSLKQDTLGRNNLVH